MRAGMKIGGAVTALGLVLVPVGGVFVTLTTYSGSRILVGIGVAEMAAAVLLSVAIASLLVVHNRMAAGPARLLRWPLVTLMAFAGCSAVGAALDAWELHRFGIAENGSLVTAGWCQAVGYGLAAVGLLVVTVSVWRTRDPGSEGTAAPAGDAPGAPSATASAT